MLLINQMADNQKLILTLFKYSIRQVADMLFSYLVWQLKLQFIPKILCCHDNGFLMCQALHNLTLWNNGHRCEDEYMWKIEVKGRQMSIRVRVRASVHSMVAADDHVASAARGTNWIWEMLFVWLSLVMDAPHKSPEIRDHSSIFSYLHLLPRSFPTSGLYHLFSLSLHHTSRFIM